MKRMLRAVAEVFQIFRVEAADVERHTEIIRRDCHNSPRLPALHHYGVSLHIAIRYIGFSSSAKPGGKGIGEACSCRRLNCSSKSLCLFFCCSFSSPSCLLSSLSFSSSHS